MPINWFGETVKSKHRNLNASFMILPPSIRLQYQRHTCLVEKCITRLVLKL